MTVSSAENVVQEVADNLYRLRLPMPFGLDHINVYLIKETNRLALVDCGLDLDDSWASLTDGFAALGLRPEDLTDIFVTHAHPDHIGALGRLRVSAPQARLYFHRVEYDRLAERVGDLAQAQVEFRAWLGRHGAEAEFLDAQDLMRSANEMLPTLRSDDWLVEGGEQISLASEQPEGEWQILWTPGHTAGHFVLHNPARRLMLSGDHLLTSISSNIGKYPGSTDDPLGDFIDSLERIARLDLAQVLPAHGQPLVGYRERINDLIAHHRKRLERMYAVLEGGPRTGLQVVETIWGERARGFHRYLALVETLSHLERLRREGRVTLEEDGGRAYFRAA